MFGTTGAVGFLAVFAVAIVVWLVFNRAGTPATRAILDRLANKKKAPGQDRVARIGETPLAPDAFGKRVLPATIGVRGISTICVIAVLYLLNLHSEDASYSPIPPDYFWEGYMAASALAAWYMGYIWTYELHLHGSRLVVPTWGFRSREYDLNSLIRVEDDGAYILRLFFEDGSRAEIVKYVRGRADLLNALERHAPPRL
ncbi:MAG: hypothetical protein AAGA15_14230 [Pseudomonadota bacterium]